MSKKRGTLSIRGERTPAFKIKPIPPLMGPTLGAKTTLRLPLDLLTAVRHRAIDEGLTLQAIVELALAAYLKSPTRPKGGAR